MKFRDLELYHVGRHNGPVFTNLEDGFNVVYGPNEAGKSTLMAGLRAMLFGRLTGSEPELGTVRGASGTLRALDESGRLYTLERALGRKSPVKVYGTDFEPQAGDEGLFTAFPELEQLESSIYQSVFTFQLQELSDLSEHRSQLAQKLYTVGMIGETSPLQLEAAFRKAAKDIYNPDKRARNPLLTQCLNTLQGLQEEQSKQQDEVGTYLAVQEEVNAAEEELQEQAKVLDQVSEVRAYLHRLKQAVPLYQTAQVSAAEQALYGERYEIAEATVTKVQQLEADITRLHQQKSQEEQVVRRLAADLDKVEINKDLLAALPQIQRQSVRREKMLALADWLEESRQTVAALRIKNEELSSQLKGDWSLPQLAQLQIDAQTVTTANEHSEQWKQLHTERQQLTQQVHTWNEQQKRRVERLTSLGISPQSPAADLNSEQARLKQKRNDLYKDEEQIEVYAQLSEQQRNIEQEIQTVKTQVTSELGQSTDVKDRTPAAVGGLGIVLAVLGIWQLAQAVLVTGIVTLAAAAAAVGLGVWVGRRRAAQRDRRRHPELEQRLSDLESNAQQTAKEMEVVLNRLQSVSSDGDASVWSLRRVFKQVQLELDEEAERIHLLQSAVDAFIEAQGALQSLLERLQYVDDNLDKLQAQSSELQQQLGWNADHCVSVTSWVKELQIVQEIRQNQWDIRQKLEKMREYQTEVASFVGDVKQLLSKLDDTDSALTERELAAADSTDESASSWNEASVEHFQSELRHMLAQLHTASDKLPQLLQQAEAAQEAQRQVQLLQQRFDETKAQLQERRQQLEEKETAVQEIYEVCGVTNQEEFAKFLDEVKSYQELKSAYRDAMMQLYGLCGGKEQYEELEQTLQQSTMEQIEEELALNEEQLQEVREQHKALNKQLGEQQARLNHWDSEQREKLEWELAQSKAERDKLAFEWAGYRLAESLVKTARERYEEQRQPEVLQAAGGLFKEVTNGRYQGFKSRFDEQGTARFVAVDQSAREWSFESLSRGTREQIYLCLRIALIRDYVNRGIRMPLVLDDPLVNFDADRLDASLRLLGQAADECQIIYLTCHHSAANRITQMLSAHSVELGRAEGEQ